jgi:hypothetical protein
MVVVDWLVCWGLFGFGVLFFWVGVGVRVGWGVVDGFFME